MLEIQIHGHGESVRRDHDADVVRRIHIMSELLEGQQGMRSDQFSGSVFPESDESERHRSLPSQRKQDIFSSGLICTFLPLSRGVGEPALVGRELPALLNVS